MTFFSVAFKYALLIKVLFGLLLSPFLVNCNIISFPFCLMLVVLFSMEQPAMMDGCDSDTRSANSPCAFLISRGHNISGKETRIT